MPLALLSTKPKRGNVGPHVHRWINTGPKSSVHTLEYPSAKKQMNVQRGSIFETRSQAKPSRQGRPRGVRSRMGTRRETGCTLGPARSKEPASSGSDENCRGTLERKWFHGSVSRLNTADDGLGKVCFIGCEFQLGEERSRVLFTSTEIVCRSLQGCPRRTWHICCQLNTRKHKVAVYILLNDTNV